MVGEALTGLAGALGVACAVLAWSHVRRIRRGATPDAARMLEALKKAPAEQRIGRFVELAPASGWEAALATELRDAPDERARIAAANDAIADVELGLVASAAWPVSALRIALFAGLLLAAVAFIATRDWGWSGAVATACVPGVVATFAASQRARSAAARERERVDGFMTLLFGRSAREPAEGTRPRASRRRG